MNMIEKVARAIYEAHEPIPDWNSLHKHEKPPFIIEAKAAIEAMREPIDNIMIEMEMAAPELMCFNKKEDSPSYKAWQAGIDAALKEE